MSIAEVKAVDAFEITKHWQQVMTVIQKKSGIKQAKIKISHCLMPDACV